WSSVICLETAGILLRSASLPRRLGLVLVVGGTRARRSDEQFLAVRQGDVPPVRAGRSILGLVAFDEDLGSDWQRIFRKSSSEQRVRRAALDHPRLDLALGVLHV